ncbi:hypothetical protein [Shewanella sp. MBTL60-007]|uniref:hypothetical protein n=1 Tax=Shewanella sp. MBTL60-007 TaxID=2815911 RepID=UPI001BBE63B5|nr:hypothetical protein [Shewanella sp. MBTL60-007]GIU16247.1 hypothetical protein TUM3792_09750 [Shewanella sp. MBTL60-007]
MPNKLMKTSIHLLPFKYQYDGSVYRRNFAARKLLEFGEDKRRFYRLAQQTQKKWAKYKEKIINKKQKDNRDLTEYSPEQMNLNIRAKIKAAYK